MRGVVAVHLLQKIFELRVKILVAEVSRQVVYAADKPLPEVGIDRFGAEFLDVLRGLLTEVFGRDRRACDADHGELAGEQFALGQVVERRNQFAPGQVAGRSEDHHHAGLADFSDALCDWHGYCLGHRLASSAERGGNDELCCFLGSGRFQFHVAAELLSHRGKHFLREGVLLA